eukprot:499791-Prymnesium_polylepis.1
MEASTSLGENGVRSTMSRSFCTAAFVTDLLYFVSSQKKHLGLLRPFCAVMLSKIRPWPAMVVTSLL